MILLPLVLLFMGVLIGIYAIVLCFDYFRQVPEQEEQQRVLSDSTTQREQHQQQFTALPLVKTSISEQAGQQPYVEYAAPPVLQSLRSQAVEQQEPVEIRMFLASKEEDNQHSEDDQACHREGFIYRCAITDGVSTSFLSSQWAKILATQFVQQEVDLKNPAICTQWLHACSAEWHSWVNSTWIPTIEQKQGRKKDWSQYIERGTQATFNGCSFSIKPLHQGDTTPIQVTAVGDANFFLVHSPYDTYEQYKAFPCKTREEFGPAPETLATAEELLQECWRHVKREQFVAFSGDSIFLVTDALARWIFLQLQQARNPWVQLLAIASNEAFLAFVRREREMRTLEVDDTTMTIICLSSHPVLHNEVVM